MESGARRSEDAGWSGRAADEAPPHHEALRGPATDDRRGSGDLPSTSTYASGHRGADLDRRAPVPWCDGPKSYPLELRERFEIVLDGAAAVRMEIPADPSPLTAKPRLVANWSG